MGVRSGNHRTTVLIAAAVGLPTTAEHRLRPLRCLNKLLSKRLHRLRARRWRDAKRSLDARLAVGGVSIVARTVAAATASVRAIFCHKSAGAKAAIVVESVMVDG